MDLMPINLGDGDGSEDTVRVIMNIALAIVCSWGLYKMLVTPFCWWKVIAFPLVAFVLAALVYYCLIYKDPYSA